MEKSIDELLKYSKSYKKEIYIFIFLTIVASISFIIYKMNNDIPINYIPIEENQIKKTNHNIAVCMWYNEGIKEYADIAKEINQKYCDLHGYDLIVDNVRRLPDRIYAWECIPSVLNVLNTDKYDYVMWIDADAFFRLDHNNPNLLDTILTENKDKDFIFSDDVPGYDIINLGVFIVRNNNYTKNILQEMIVSEDDKCKLYKDWPAEQRCMINMYHTKIKDNSIILPIGDIQSLRGHYEQNNDIFKKSFILHLAGESNKYRSEIMNKFKNAYQL